MKLFKRFLPQLAVILTLCIMSGIGMVYEKTAPAAASAKLPLKVIIDAGHGGFDGGAMAHDGTVEKDINLLIAKRVCSLLRLQGIEVIMTRTEDSGTEDNSSVAIAKRKKSDLQNRLKMMSDNPDAVYVSIHLNKFTTSAANGAQVFYTKNFDEARVLGDCIQQSIVYFLQPENDRVIKQGTQSTYLLKNAKVPAVIVECGFLSNKTELARLKTQEYQSQMAFCIASGICTYYGF